MNALAVGIDSCQDRLSDYLRKKTAKIVARRTGFPPDTVSNWIKKKSLPNMNHLLILEKVYGDEFNDYVKGEWLGRERANLDIRLGRIHADLTAILEDTRHVFPSLAGKAAGALDHAVCQTCKAIKRTGTAAIVLLALAGGAFQPDDAVRVPTVRTGVRTQREMIV